MDERIALQAAIDKLYTIFARYPLRHPVIGCPHCVSQVDQERIASKPLRQLKGEDLERFAWKAMSTKQTHTGLVTQGQDQKSAGRWILHVHG